MKKFLCVLLAAVMLVGCASAIAEEKIKLQIYGQYADDDTKVPYDYAVEKLAEAYPNVELELIPQAQDDGVTLLALATAGNLPDIYQTGSGIVITLRNNPLVAVNTGLVNDQLPKMMQDLVAEMPNMTSTTCFTWGLTNTTLSNAIGVAGQSLLSGQYTAQEVIDQLVFELGW